MKNWRAGIKPAKVHDNRHMTMKILIALMATMRVDVDELIENLTGPKGRQYAEALMQALDTGIEKEYDKAFKELTK